MISEKAVSPVFPAETENKVFRSHDMAIQKAERNFGDWKSINFLLTFLLTLPRSSADFVTTKAETGNL